MIELSGLDEIPKFPICPACKGRNDYWICRNGFEKLLFVDKKARERTCRKTNKRETTSLYIGFGVARDMNIEEILNNTTNIACGNKNHYYHPADTDDSVFDIVFAYVKKLLYMGVGVIYE